MQTDPLAVEIGSRIRSLRTGRGMTGAALAAELKIPASALTAWEHGRVAPSAHSLLALMRALACGPSDLLPAGEARAARPLPERLKQLPPEALADVERFVTLLERAHRIE